MIGKKSVYSSRRRRSISMVNRHFQWRYTRYLLGTIAAATIFTGGLATYFLNQNYSIFKRLAFLHAPDLLPHLEREQLWINTFVIAFVVALITFNLIFGLRTTSRIAGPVMILQKHVRHLARGLFSQRPIRVRESDEFRELVDSYNYFYMSLQAQIRKDIQQIEFAIKSSAPESRAVLEDLLKEKKCQINETFESLDSTGDSRRAS